MILIEAATKSGSLITTRFALDQGRDVFAVPGHPLDPRSSGGNHLIKTGQAHLVESAEDVLQALGMMNQISRPLQAALDAVEDAQDAQTEIQFNPSSKLTNDQSRQAVLECLSHTPCTVDQITFTTQLPVSNVLTILMELELSGRISRLSGDRIILA